MSRNWKCEVTPEMLPAAHRKLADVIGLEATLELCEAFGGETIYIPLTEAVYSMVRRKWIREEYLKNGCNTAGIARKYGISEREVQRIICDVRPDQLTMFDIG